MMKSFWLVALAIASALFASSASAQPTQSGLPPYLASSGVTQLQWREIQREVSRQSRRAGVTEAALLAAAEAAGARLAATQRFEAAALQQTILTGLEDQAYQISDLQRRLDALTADADPEMAPRYSVARAAIDEGRLSEADSLLGQLAERDLAAIQDAEREIERRRVRAGGTIGVRGSLAYAQGDHLIAAQHFSRAAEVTPDRFTAAQWLLRFLWAGTLYMRGDLYNEPAQIRRSLELFDASLRLAPRETSTFEWANTQLGRALALWALAKRGDAEALNQAITTFESIVDAIDPQTHRREWMGAQLGLATALMSRGEDGDADALARATQLLERVLQSVDREQDPNLWAYYQSTLGEALRQRGELGDVAAFTRAVAAHESALQVWSRADQPGRWAQAQGALGMALVRWGERGEPGATARGIAALEAALQAHNQADNPVEHARLRLNLGVALASEPTALPRALAHLEAAQRIFTRDADAPGWAQIQRNKGFIYQYLANQGDEGAVRLSIDAFQTALEVLTRERDPRSWAISQSGLGDSLMLLAERGDRDARTRAIAAFELSLGELTRDRDSTRWAEVHLSLGLAVLPLSAQGDATAVPRALASFDSAQQVLRRESTPELWAKAQGGRGIALLASGLQGDIEALQMSVAALDEALPILTADRHRPIRASYLFTQGIALAAQAELARANAQVSRQFYDRAIESLRAAAGLTQDTSTTNAQQLARSIAALEARRATLQD